MWRETCNSALKYDLAAMGVREGLAEYYDVMSTYCTYSLPDDVVPRLETSATRCLARYRFLPRWELGGNRVRWHEVPKLHYA